MSQVTPDRLVRPIYDAIDAGSNKSALQQCNKVLKKYPQNDLVKALKALAIVRMNKIEECLPLCDEVLANKPTDLETLNAMMHVLRALGRHTDLVTMFDDAYRAHPTNEELGMQDFFANVRTGNWKAAQQIAQRLHKAFGVQSLNLGMGIAGGDRFLYWAVIGALLQAQDAETTPEMREILHKLAHRLLTTATSTGGAPPHASVDRMHVHLRVLTELGMHDGAAALLETPEGCALARANLYIDALRRENARERKLFADEGTRARAKLVDEGERDWLEFLSVLDAAFADEPIDVEKVNETRVLFRKLAEQDGHRERAPMLALLELERRAREKDVSSNSESSLLGLLKHYFEQFGDKAACYEDLKQYTNFQDAEPRLFAAFLDAHEHSFEDMGSLQRSINIYKLRRYVLIADELSAEAERERALTYLRSYMKALPLGGALPETEIQPVDDLVILAAQTFVGLWRSQNDVAWLYMATAALEYGSERSKNYYLIRLHLVRIYRLLAAPALALQHYRAIRVKQVQNDTLSHFILARASTFSLAASGDLTFTQECVDASQIYVTNAAETSDYIVRAFATEKYSQIQDLISFEDQLDNSLERDLVKIEHVRMRLAHEGPSTDLVDTELIELKFIFDRIHHDNRDFDILANYQPLNMDSVDAQTLMINSPGLNWLTTFLRTYIRAFILASDIDDTVEENLLIGDRPKLTDNLEHRIPLRDRIHIHKEEELNELSPDELALFKYISALCDWLAPYHDHARPSPEAVLAEANRQQELRSGKNAKAVPSNGSSTLLASNGHKKNAEEPPAVRDPPEVVCAHFDSIATRFKEAVGAERPPWELLHVANLAQEAALMLSLVSMRFKDSAVVKANKFGQLANYLRTQKQEAASVLKGIASGLNKIGSQASTSEQRRAFVAACKPIMELPEFENDMLIDIAKRFGDSRKKVIEGFAKGITKVVTTQLQ